MNKILTLLMVLFLIGCAHSGSNEKRYPANSENEKAPEPKIIYVMYGKDSDKITKTEVLDLIRWSEIRPGGRDMFLRSFYYSTTRATSNAGLKHDTCFVGVASDIADIFIRSAQFSKLKDVTAAVSDDEFMIGISFLDEGKHRSFRISNCDSGKMPILFKESDEKTAANQRAKFVNPERKLASTAAPKATPNLKFGFEIADKASGATTKLPKFALQGNYSKMVVKANDRPWRGMNLTDAKESLKFAFMMQKYVYEGMANQDPKNVNKNFIAQKNPVRDWCHMPWMHVGANGREAIHGMTKERDLKVGIMPLYSKATPGTDWGIGYYNAAGCQTIGKIFGSYDPENPKSAEALAAPQFSNVEFADGTVSAKILFTTADFDLIKTAYTWTANVSGVGSTVRKLQNVRHIQMDIAVRDSTLTGADPKYNNWVMLTYYFDPNFDYDKEYSKIIGANPLSEISNLPKELLKMRPQGVQVSFDKPEKADGKILSHKGGSQIFANAETNGLEFRLNGPADNHASSCLSCHGTAGTKVKMSPGFMSAAEWNSANKTGMLDFSQQIALAKRNFQTELGR